MILDGSGGVQKKDKPKQKFGTAMYKFQYVGCFVEYAIEYLIEFLTPFYKTQNTPNCSYDKIGIGMIP